MGLTAHFLVAYNWQWVEADLSGKNGKDVVLTTLYLQVPQHVLEITSSILLSYGMAKGKRQFFLPWLIINAIGISLYSTVLLVMGMVVSNYTFFGFLFIGKRSRKLKYRIHLCCSRDLRLSLVPRPVLLHRSRPKRRIRHYVQHNGISFHSVSFYRIPHSYRIVTNKV